MVSQRILVYDTETDGLLEKDQPPPYIVQLSYAVYDSGASWDFSSPAEEYNVFVTPRRPIPPGATEVHGITTARARREGRPIAEVIANFLGQVARADIIVAHNASFDKAVVHGEMRRLQLIDPEAGPYTWTTRPGAHEVCTMQISTAPCALEFAGTVRPWPDDNRTKFPKLRELHAALFPYDPIPAGLHDAMLDVRCAARCFFRIAATRRDIIGVL